MQYPEKLIYQSNYRVFQKVMQKSPMMNDPESRSLIGALCVLESIGTTGIKERLRILKEHKIIFSKDDLYFTLPLVMYNIITKIAMRNIVSAMMKSSDMKEFHDNLNPLGRMLVYTHVKSLMNFYKLSLNLHEMGLIPDVGYEFYYGFLRLYCLRDPIEKLFRPDDRQRHTSPLIVWKVDDSAFTAKNKMIWYMAVTDMDWTKDFIGNIISYRLPVLTKVLKVIEKSIIQKFFDMYISGIKKLNTGKPLNRDELVLLSMIYEIDMATYSELMFYYSNCDILPDAFFEDFEKFYNNVLCVRGMVHG